MKPYKHWYPEAKEGATPSPWWYYGRAIYVSRHDYRKIFVVFMSIGIPLGLSGLLIPYRPLFLLALVTGGIGLALLLYSLFGLYRQYGHPAKNYFSRIIRLAGLKDGITVADIHIGTYRHSNMLSKLLPNSTICSVDCWKKDGFSSELAIRDVRELEKEPAENTRIRTMKMHEFSILLPDRSCDAIVFGFGTHEIPKGGPREKIFSEAQRILKPGGKALLFEHGIDLHNYLIFGPVIYHVTRHSEWMEWMNRYFTNADADTMYAVNMIVATKK